MDRTIQIQHLLKLNFLKLVMQLFIVRNSNTTLVKVKYQKSQAEIKFFVNDSNTTLVKVKFNDDENIVKITAVFKYNTC